MEIGDYPPRSRRHQLPQCPEHILVEWYRYALFRAARQHFKRTACLYAFVDPACNLPDYVGKTTTGLGKRYSRAPKASEGQLVFVAPLESPYLELVEHTLIFWDSPVFNRRGSDTLPLPHVPLLHRYDGVESWWGSGHPRTGKRDYEGPLFCRPGVRRGFPWGELLM